MLKKWEDLPAFMRVDEVRPYWEILNRKRGQLLVKRCFDMVIALVLSMILFLPMVVIAICIKLDSKGPIIYRQERVTAYGKHFMIHKFRTMIVNADRIGAAVTAKGDNRVTWMGTRLRHLRLDELPQLIDVLQGNMSFVGTRPEAVRYVEHYQSEMFATLLMPAGITSETSIRYKDEEKLLTGADDVDRTYLEEVLPEKMKWNLKSIKQFSVFRDLLTMVRTVLAVFGKEY